MRMIAQIAVCAKKLHNIFANGNILFLRAITKNEDVFEFLKCNPIYLCFTYLRVKSLTRTSE